MKEGKREEVKQERDRKVRREGRKRRRVGRGQRQKRRGNSRSGEIYGALEKQWEYTEGINGADEQQRRMEGEKRLRENYKKAEKGNEWPADELLSFVSS